MKRDTRQVSVGFVWAAVGLTGVYIGIHLPMLSRSLEQWGRLLSALVGQ